MFIEAKRGATDWQPGFESPLKGGSNEHRGRMSNRELRDLGIERADIDRVARTAFAR
ncbi:DUF1127 domain-containing protein [Ensifer sp. Root1298]|uniref:DUF1127 domain-containing protein n=1 Tax=Ensifer sp. Root1298 TaxID=1736449 RepID=UPI000A5FBF11|nr:DUF1127 domain-containing protein [Ensifer sp. Root1298]